MIQTYRFDPKYSEESSDGTYVPFLSSSPVKRIERPVLLDYQGKTILVVRVEEKSADNIPRFSNFVPGYLIKREGDTSTVRPIGNVEIRSSLTTLLKSRGFKGSIEFWSND